MSAALEQVVRALKDATAAGKCHGCGCFQEAVATLEYCDLASPLAGELARARAAFRGRDYDCKGCEICWPADALRIAEGLAPLPESPGCPTAPAEKREGWPPYPGHYRFLRYSAPVAVCTLHSHALVAEVAALAPAGLSITGSLQTENLGIERLISNVVANPHIRFLLLCGEDSEGRIGHLPGQSLLSLIHSGLDEHGRITEAEGRRPVLRNVDRTLVDHFRHQVEPTDRRGLTAAQEIASLVKELASRNPGPLENIPPVGQAVRLLRATPPGRLTLDPAGYVVIYPDRERSLLVAEHYRNRGVLHSVVEGADGIEVMATLLGEGLVTRLDHAAYLGRELARAEAALRSGAAYLQDRAPEGKPGTVPGSDDRPSCGCDRSCGES